MNNRRKKRRNMGWNKDRAFNEVQNIIESKKYAAKTAEVEVVREAYVDAYRSIAFGQDTSDLRSQIKEAGMNAQSGAVDLVPGDPNDEMYLRQAEHLMKRGALQAAIIYLHQSLTMNPESKLAMTSLARCYLLMGDWKYAEMAAEVVLDVDKYFVKAIYAKAEALYNTCQFEHALVLFHRGSRLSPDLEEFRLGIRKCRKLIQNAISPNVFRVRGAKCLFKIFRRVSDLRTARGCLATAIASSTASKMDSKTKSTKSQKANPFSDMKVPGGGNISLTGLTSIVGRKKKDATSSKVKAKARWGIGKFTNCRTLDGNEKDDDKLTEHEKRVIRVEERCKAKAKKAFSSDRLLEDKSYLAALVKGIGHRPDLDVDIVEEEVSDVAYEALHFLKGREQFWKQVRLGQGKH